MHYSNKILTEKLAKNWRSKVLLSIQHSSFTLLGLHLIFQVLRISVFFF